MATCQSCFKKVPDEASHCPHCGAPQQKADSKKTVFGYAAGAELQHLAQGGSAPAQPPPAGQPPAGDALAKTMFAQDDSPPNPAQEPAFKAPNVRPLQIDPALRTPLIDPAAHVNQPAPTPAAGYQPVAAAPGAAESRPTPSTGFPPTMAVPGAAAPQAVPPTMAVPAPAPAPMPVATAPTPAAPQPSVGTSRGTTGRVSAGLYLAFILGGAVISGGLTGLAVANLSHMHELLYFSWMPSILSIVFFFILLYKAWAALQDGQTPVSPGKALGFLFIPFFNLYWIFVAFGAWGKQYNLFAERNNIGGPRMNEGLFIAYPVLCIVPIANIAAPIVAIIVILKFCQGINTIADASA